MGNNYYEDLFKDDYDDKYIKKYKKIIETLAEKYDGKELKELTDFLENIRDREMFLSSLEYEGVKSWTFYDFACDSKSHFENSSNTDFLIPKIIDNIKEGRK